MMQNIVILLFSLTWWRPGLAVRVGLDQCSYSTPGLVNTWMGDSLWMCKPSWYATSHLGQLSLLSLRGR